ncbi:phage tail protein [Flavobacterium pectinovorum]|uniref:phage tail protein n=1 Tax=Flavobacterium pectinovorum TaxID=29533 RepID=UPI001FAE7333|nr:tail fiber protein [Flavobacterium pectinovorum]MCI9846972.1 phage tail protein [Flavobacterium pectinovorum]
MSTEPFIGEIKIFGFDFPPRGYMSCNGQLLSIAQNTALFSLLGTVYGGNGQATFGLPNLQGRMPIGQGQGAGLPPYAMGQVAGTTNVTLLTSNIPAHTHPAAGLTVNIPVSTGGPDIASPEGAFLADTGVEIFSSIPTATKNYGASTVGGNTGPTGASTPFSIMNPYLVINYSIATQGIFPSRN